MIAIKVNDRVEIMSATGPIAATVVGRYAGTKGDANLILRVPGMVPTVVLPESEVTLMGLSPGNEQEDFVDWTPEQHIDAAAALLEKYPHAGEMVELATARVIRAQWHILQATLKRERSHSSMFNVFRAEHRRQQKRNIHERVQGLQAQHDRHRLGADDA